MLEVFSLSSVLLFLIGITPKKYKKYTDLDYWCDYFCSKNFKTPKIYSIGQVVMPCLCSVAKFY